MSDCCQVCDRELWTDEDEFESAPPIPGIGICRACTRSALLYAARQAQGRPHPLPEDWDKPETIPMKGAPND
ncbi:hypothetical protein LCGC14_1537010 [marine sediment metagenome]|uniref:Uncharacterized protein n=1 Tax=marine sediment metagenome TaxID=412755 RepID=A0A0F9LA14_9ZZZZ